MRISNKPFCLSVRAIIKDQQGRCLLVRRSNVCENFVGKWEWPGGTVEEGETFIQALVREVREETGLEVVPVKFFGVFEMELKLAQAVVLCMETNIIGGTFKINAEHDEYSWVPVQDLLDWDLMDALRGFIINE